MCPARTGVPSGLCALRCPKLAPALGFAWRWQGLQLGVSTIRCAALPMLVPLVLLVKRLLDQRALKRAYSGGLSSYAVFIMAVRFLTDWRDAMRRRQQQEHGAPPSAGGGVLLGQAGLARSRADLAPKPRWHREGIGPPDLDDLP